MNSLIYLGHLIKDAREQKKISRIQLAAKLFIDISVVSKLEKGKYRPSYNLICRLAIILELNADILSFLARRPGDELQQRLEKIYDLCGYGEMINRLDAIIVSSVDNDLP